MFVLNGKICNKLRSHIFIHVFLQIQIMYYQIIRQNRARDLHVCADRAMLVLNTITAKTKEEVLGNLSIGISNLSSIV